MLVLRCELQSMCQALKGLTITGSARPFDPPLDTEAV